MKDPENDMFELYELVEKLNCEADRSIKYISALKTKGTNAVRKAESVFTPSIRQKEKNQAKQAVYKLIERLVEVNCDLELADDEYPNLVIPSFPVGNSSVQLKFLTGDNPWNFWLVDDTIDTRTLHKNLLKKYQNELLDPYPHPKPLESVCFLDRHKVFRGIVLQSINENRVKVVDCDSNISKVVDSEKVFKADPDACHIHASTLKCTISKDLADVGLWNADLRDVFCNALKEAVLHVTVLEKLSGNFPSFLVDVELHSEDEDVKGNLREWITNKLLPELKKVSSNNNESVCDFLSAEALNPYHRGSYATEPEVNSVINIDEESVTVKSQNEEFNNLNSHSNKVSVKIVPNLAHSENELLTPEANDSGIVTSSSDNSLTPSLADPEVDVNSTAQTEAKTDNNTDICTKGNITSSDSEEKCQQNEVINSPPLASPTKPNHTSSLPPAPKIYSTYNYPQPAYSQPSFPPPGFTQPSYPPSGFSPYPHPMFVSTPHIRHNMSMPWSYTGAPSRLGHNGWNHAHPPSNFQHWHPPGNLPNLQQSVSKVCTVYNNEKQSEAKQKSWSTGDEFHPNSDKEKTDDSVKIANINNISVNVNVMAPEFVPKQCNSTKEFPTEQNPKTDLSSSRCGTPSLPPPKDEMFHVELRKPTSLLKPNDNLLVMIAHVESPSEFYVHFISNNNKYLDKLVNEMMAYYAPKNKVNFQNWQEAKRALGKFCACKSLEDNHWYRVQVLDWALGDNHVKVYFVDYGNTEEVPLSCLQPLIQQYTKLSMAAQRCHLAKVYPLVKGEEWTSEAIEFFKSKVEATNTKVYSVTVVPSRKNINSLSVLLYEGKKMVDSESINDLMVDNGLAWSKRLTEQSASSGSSDVYYSMDDMSVVSDAPPSSENLRNLPMQHSTDQIPVELDEDWETWDPLAEDFHGLRNNPAIDTDDAGVALIGYSARDEARICKFYAKKGYCWKQVCNKEHTMPNTDDVTTDKEEIYIRAFAEMELPLVGDVIQVKVTSVSSISLFYVQLEEYKGLDMDNDDDDPETLSTLGAFLNSPENTQKMKYLKVDPALGQLVLAKDEGMWYRARVISADDENPEVMFVDYGSICTVSRMDLREMEPCYLHLPFQAIECCLANIIPPAVGTEKYDEGTELLRETIELYILTAKVHDSSSGETFQRMELVLEDEAIGDVGEYLVDKGFASKLSVSWDHTFSYGREIKCNPG